MAFWNKEEPKVVEKAVEEVAKAVVAEVKAPQAAPEPSVRADVKGLEAAVGNMKATRERLVGRAQRLKAHIEKNPDHPKLDQHQGELKAILRELGAREELINEIMGR